MKISVIRFTVVALCAALAAGSLAAPAEASDKRKKFSHGRSQKVQLGPRPFYLLDKMSDGELKDRLQKCTKGPFRRTDFSIGHRGAALQFPEHTKESYEAAARMGAGIVECDVTFTQDKELVCRHSQNDLATTTNILLTPLASTCIVPFTPATFNPDGSLATAATASCRTSEITKDEFLTLEGKMDARDRTATTPEAFQGGTANWRTDLYATGGTLLTHAQSIELFKELGVKFTPELKAPSVAMPFDGFSQEDYAQKMIDEYKAARVKPKHVWAQSFNLDDVKYWIANERKFGKQAVFLDGRSFDAADPSDDGLDPNLQQLADMGVNIVAPPQWVLLTEDAGEIVPSRYAEAAKAADLDIITWTLERSGRIVEEVLEGGGSAFYYQSTLGAIENDGDLFTTLDVLAQDVGILGIFSDWPATVTYYANCMKL